MPTFKRQLTFIINGTPQPGKVIITSPEIDGDGIWSCRWSIDFISPESGCARGTDELEALTRAVGFVSRLIRGSEEDGLTVWWQAPNDHGGFDG